MRMRGGGEMEEKEQYKEGYEEGRKKGGEGVEKREKGERILKISRGIE